MKFSINKIILLLSLATTLLWSSCNIDEIPNPNGADLEDLTSGATPSELQTIVTGIEASMGNDIGFYYDAVSIIGREYWFLTGSDPRYTGELLGREESQLDNAGFYGTRPYFGRYRTVKNANILLEAVANAAPGLSAADISGYNGFAKTIQAYEMLLVLNLQYQNGIRIDVSNPEALGAFVEYDQALGEISRILDEASDELDQAGGSFNFSLSSAWSGFDTPATFKQANRGLSARVAIYLGDKIKALNSLSSSFMDMAGDINTGPAVYFSAAGGETPNPLFRARNQADAIIAHPSFVDALDANDLRNNKIAQRNEELTLDGLAGDWDVVVFQSFSDNLPIIRNEELILLAAEANIGTNNAAAIAAIDAVRAANNLPVYSGANSDAALLDEVLHQRWLSLYGEGHRWVDMRRYGRLAQLPIDRPGDDVWEQMPRPAAEIE
jgi:starch-binding outer membrane protein, SusD/RagB family